MINVLSVIGTRPEAIKMAPVLAALGRRPGEFRSRVVVTGQHREMLDQMLDLFGITPDHDLDLMKPGQAVTDVFAEVLRRLPPIIAAERPDWVLVQGDTTTVAAASLAAFHQKVRVGHVEAGLRTYDKYSPFPEEMNRKVTGTVADLHFAPTAAAANNLRIEGIPVERITVTGNTVIDSLKRVGHMEFDVRDSLLADVPFGDRRVVLVTAHRRENFGGGIEEICGALGELAKRRSDLHLVMPVHPNPSIRATVYRMLSGNTNVTLCPPLDYQPLVWLLNRCHFVITDSGGIQEEACGLGRPVLVLRETTERPEGVLAGTARLVGSDHDQIVEWGERLLDDDGLYAKMSSRGSTVYGRGDAGELIVNALRRESAAYDELPPEPAFAIVGDDLPDAPPAHPLRRWYDPR